jgi:hypothetical protein
MVNCKWVIKKEEIHRVIGILCCVEMSVKDDVNFSLKNYVFVIELSWVWIRIRNKKKY